jgi:hypothetical protein
VLVDADVAGKCERGHERNAREHKEECHREVGGSVPVVRVWSDIIWGIPML